MAKFPATRRLLLLQLIVAVVMVCAAADGVWGQPPSWIPTPRTHPWSRFGPLAWKEVRVRKTTFDEEGNAQRTSETVTRTRVRNVGPSTFSLSITSSVLAVGRQFPSTPQTITLRIAPDVMSSRELGAETVTIDGQDYGTQVVQFVTTGGGTQRTSTLHYCDDTCPQMLKQHTTTRDLTTNEVTSETTVTVTKINKVSDVLGELKRVWHVTTVCKKADATITTQEIKCQDVPGELVSQVTEERDSHGRLVSRNELEVTGYSCGGFRGLFRRRR